MARTEASPNSSPTPDVDVLRGAPALEHPPELDGAGEGPEVVPPSKISTSPASDPITVFPPSVQAIDEKCGSLPEVSEHARQFA